MSDKLQKLLEEKCLKEGFIKVTEKPTESLSSEQKAILNRKGNTIFNSGDVNTARRIFLATGYSDGLTRIGDTFLQRGDELTALKYYWLAHNKRKASPLIAKTAQFLQALLHEE